MENIKKYKRSVVGHVPASWGISTFGENFEIQLGKMLSPKATKEGEQLPYLANINVRWDGFETSNLRRMSFSDREKEKYSLKRGDLMVCEGGEIGRCSIWNEEVLPCYFQKAIHRLRPVRKEAIDIRYAKSYLHRIVSSSKIKGVIGETSIAHLTREQFIKFPLILPSLPEQKAIAEVLNSWDRGIRQLEAKLAAKRRIKKGLMQELLSGRRRLAGFGPELNDPDDAAAIPEGWSDVKLADVVEFQYGKDWKTVADPEGEFSVYGTGGLMGKSNRALFSAPAVVLGRKGTIDKPFYVTSPFWAVDTTFIIHTKRQDILKFLYFKFLTINWKNYGEASGVPSLSRPTLQDIKVILPPVEEQKVIVEILDAADRELDALERKLATWKVQKKYLLNNLVDGTIRLPQFIKAEAS